MRRLHVPLRSRWLASVLLPAVICAFPAGAALRDTYDTPIKGGSAGTAFTLACPRDQVLVGVEGKFSTRFDRLEGICKWVDINGYWVGTATTHVHDTSPNHSGGTGSGSQSFRWTCPTNYALAGFDLQFGTSVTRLRIACKRVGAGGLTTGSVSWYGSTTGWQPTPGGPYLCANNWPARGLIGRATSSYISAIGLRCAKPTIPFGWFAFITTANTSEAITTKLGPNAEDAIANHNIRQIVTDENVRVRADNLPCQSCHTGPGAPGNFNAATIDRLGFCAKVPPFAAANKPEILKRLFNDWAGRTCPN